MIKSVNLVVLYSACPGELACFYQALGLSFKKEKHGKGPEHLSAALDGAVFEIYPFPEGQEPSPTRRLTFGVSVEDLDDVVAAAREAGGKVRLLDERQAIITDPVGHRFFTSEVEGGRG